MTQLRVRRHFGTAAFTTRDPLDGVSGTPTATNPYHYADNDPLNKTDPTGLRPQDGLFQDGDCVAVGGSCMPLGADDDDEGVYLPPGSNLTTARYVAVYLPATCQAFDDAQNGCTIAGHASRIYNEAKRADSSVAMISWAGYQRPGGLVDALRTTPNAGAGPQLAELVSFLKSKGKIVSVIGHSWSGDVLNGAIRAGARPRNAIYLGSVSMPPNEHPRGWGDLVGSDETRYWWSCNGSDIVCGRSKINGATTLDSGSSGHEYTTPGSRGACAVGWVIVGRYARATSESNDPCRY